MAILDQSFVNTFKNVEASNDFEPIPPGEYILKVSQTELKNTKDGYGQYIKVAFTVVGPKYEGRKIFTNFNIRNHSQDAERIGASQLKSLVIAGGVQEPLVDTDQLIGATVSARVTVEKSKDPQYGDQNRVSRYQPVNAPSMPAAAPAVHASAAAPVQGASTFSAAFAPAATAAAAASAQPTSARQSWFK